MAGFTNPDDLQRLKMTATTRLKASDISIRDFDLRSTARRRQQEEIRGRLDDLARTPEAVSDRPPATLTLGAFDVDFGSLASGLVDESPADKLLREAQNSIRAERYPEALATLGKVLELEPRHPKALYFCALCQYRMQQPIKALKTLCSIDGQTASNRLNTQIRLLREELRDACLPAVQRLYAAAVKAKKPQQAIEKLQEMIQLDPTVGRYYEFLAGLLYLAERYEEAAEVAARGLENCQTDRQRLEEFCAKLTGRRITQSLNPARKQFRARKFAEARQSLHELPPMLHRDPLWNTFDGYLERLTARGGGLKALFASKDRTGIDPPGTPREAEALYEYLVEPEMRAARKALEAAQSRTAERALLAALEHVPRFPLANELYAKCVYQRVADDVKRRIDKELTDEDLSRLRSGRDTLAEARPYAVLATADPDSTDAQQLLQSLDSMIKQIDDLLTQYEIRKHDAKIVNEAVVEFIEILVLILSGIDSREKFYLIFNRMSAFAKDIARRKRACKLPEAKRIMDKLDEIISPNLRTLRAVKAQLGL